MMFDRNECVLRPGDHLKIKKAPMIGAWKRKFSYLQGYHEPGKSQEQIASGLTPSSLFRRTEGAVFLQ
jgi:hypothetical protein